METQMAGKADQPFNTIFIYFMLLYSNFLSVDFSDGFTA